MQSKRDEYREEINEIDEQIISLIDYRIDMMQMIDLWNQQNYLPSEDAKRSAEVTELYEDCLGSNGTALAKLLQAMKF